MRLYIIFGAAFIGIATSFYIYFQYSQNKIQALQENNAQLTISIESQNDAINILRKSSKTQAEQLDTLRISNRSLQTEKIKLSNKLLKHDWEELSKRKPVLMENRLNNGTKELFDSFVTITTD